MTMEWMKGGGHGIAPIASLCTRSRTIRLNGLAVALVASGCPKFCVMGYDSETRIVGIQLTADGATDGARRFSVQTKGGGAAIACEKIFKLVGITRLPRPLRCAVTYDAKLLQFRLKVPIVEAEG